MDWFVENMGYMDGMESGWKNLPHFLGITEECLLDLLARVGGSV